MHRAVWLNIDAMTPQKRKLPANARPLKAGETILNGDLQWWGNKWREVIGTSGGRIVLQSRVGFYWRKTK